MSRTDGERRIIQIGKSYPPIKIGEFTYKVEAVSELKTDNGDDLYSQIDYAAGKITVETGHPPDRNRTAILHEVLHGLSECYELEFSEKQVSVLANVLPRFFRENVSFMQFMAELEDDGC